jgi:hypothetical protein
MWPVDGLVVVMDMEHRTRPSSSGDERWYDRGASIRVVVTEAVMERVMTDPELFPRNSRVL